MLNVDDSLFQMNEQLLKCFLVLACWFNLTPVSPFSITGIPTCQKVMKWVYFPHNASITRNRKTPMSQ